MSQANNSRWFQPWTYEGFSYMLPRCLFKFDYSHACKQASVKDLQTIVSSKEFFHVDLWLSTEKKLWVLKTPFEVIVSVEIQDPRSKIPPPPHLWTYTIGLPGSRLEEKQKITSWESNSVL